MLLPARELTDLGTEPYLETLTLILWPKSAVFLGVFRHRFRVRVSDSKFRALFMVRVRDRVISGYDVMIDICTALR